MRRFKVTIKTCVNEALYYIEQGGFLSLEIAKKKLQIAQVFLDRGYPRNHRIDHLIEKYAGRELPVYKEPTNQMELFE